MPQVALGDVKTALYDIVGAPEYDEVFEAFKNREAFRVWLISRRDGRKFSAMVRITTINLNPSRPDRFTFRAFVVPPGRWIRVEGALLYDSPGRKGMLQVVSQKCCDQCGVTPITLDTRCDRCGNELRTQDVPSLESQD